MLDPGIELTAQVTSNIVVEVFKSCLQGLMQSGKWLFVKGKEQDFLGIAAKRYTQKWSERYNNVRIIGMDRPIPLRSIYVRVNILTKITSRQRISLDTLQRDFDFDRRQFGTTKETRPGDTIVDELQKFIVLGKPGVGKTTFLKYLTLQGLDGRTRSKRLPIFISLKDFSDSNQSLMDFIVDEFSVCQFPEAKPFVTYALENGKCQLLFDGLDEVSKGRDDAVAKEILKFSEKYERNQFILSCRVAAYNYWFPHFTDLEIADFNDEQIRTFISNWFLDDAETANLCWRKVNESIQIKELATIPLLLTLLCIAFDESMDFPRNRAELYKEATDALLRKWDATRRIKREETYKHLSSRRKEYLLSKIAAQTFEQGEYFLPQRALENHISGFIQNLPEAKEATLEPDSEAILKSIEAQHGIIVERAQGIYSFAHLTFQEYFTAKYIVDNAQKGTLKLLVDKHITDLRWREVFLLTAGLLPEADELLLLMLRKVEEFIRNADLVKYIKGTRAIQRNDSSHNSTLSRAIAIMYGVSKSFDRAGFLDLKLSRDFISKIVVDLTSTFAIEFDFDQGFTTVVDIERAESLEHDLALTALEFQSALTLAKDLRVYLTLNELLTKCLNAECYISRDTRHTIYDEMLLVN